MPARLRPRLVWGGVAGGLEGSGDGACENETGDGARENETGDGARVEGDCDERGGLADDERANSVSGPPLSDWMGTNDSGLSSRFTTRSSSSRTKGDGLYDDD